MTDAIKTAVDEPVSDPRVDDKHEGSSSPTQTKTKTTKTLKSKIFSGSLTLLARGWLV
jgi:hypothetical protein